MDPGDFSYLYFVPVCAAIFFLAVFFPATHDEPSQRETALSLVNDDNQKTNGLFIFFVSLLSVSNHPSPSLPDQKIFSI